jgi:predicted acyl esterase
MHRRLPVLVALVISLACAASAHAASAPDKGTAFEPKPLSQPLYGTKGPETAPAVQRHWVIARDGVRIYVETWLPAAKGENVPPATLPTILVATPYAKQGVSRYSKLQPNDLVPYFTARGYAVAVTHVRGTGESGGCLEQTAANQIDDTARVIEYLGRDAAWTDGNVGMYGKSYDAETQVSTAGLGGAARTKYLKAIVPIASVGGQYEYSNMDGVPFAGQAALSNATYLALTSATPGETTPEQPTQMAEKLTCTPELSVMAADPTGDLNPVWAAREYRSGAKNITAATLWVHGLFDFNVLPVALAGFFDRLPDSTPHAGLFGVWAHEYPDSHANTEKQWERPDFFPMVLAWYDRYLKGLDTGVEAWPRVQIQDNLGQWRSEPEFPHNAGAPTGQLALGNPMALGTANPSMLATYAADHEAVFQTAPLTGPLHITGVPVADLWLQTVSPTAQVVAKLSVFDATGKLLNAHSVTHGARSLRHLDPMPDGYFAQTQGRVPPLNTPVRVPVKFLPTDLVVPAGGRLELRIGATGGVRTVLATGATSQVSILGDCARPSALRFEMPSADAPLLNVRETDEPATKPLSSTPQAAGVQDGGGLATAPLCGRGPFDPQGLLTGEYAAGFVG